MNENQGLRSYLSSRRSVTLPFLGEPGPDEGQLAELLTLASRVPDHGKLAPWRFVVFAGAARQEAGDRLAALLMRRNPQASQAELDAERARFLPAPVTVGVVSTARPHPKIPEVEQLLAAGNVCFNLCHAANALGFGAHWVTRWFSHDEEASALFGVEAPERFVGLVHIGTPEARLEDRDRPDIETITSYWRG